MHTFKNATGAEQRKKDMYTATKHHATAEIRRFTTSSSHVSKSAAEARMIEMENQLQSKVAKSAKALPEHYQVPIHCCRCRVFSHSEFAEKVLDFYVANANSTPERN